ncbi:glutathione S-transferase 1 isoform X4 [Tetranychus urticae]|uniref:glutathione S-transferase 1 isoform X2 n=1 Tax=Tetranychus urticae TaxID=32264 RepID=UPI000D65905B|nr:glutathione S-transferase 1 isoform X2 [Tetranychus urticae]XP_025017889.1 glutathione S-transferase 1 isoform X4 [Tetranychus urticae]
MPLQLYYDNLSPPSRVVRILVKEIGLDVEEKQVNLMAGDHMKPEFLAINPFHCVPTLVDDGYALWESRSIITYLVDKFAHGHSLYPTDLHKRATVNRWLYWDSGTFYPSLSAYYTPGFAGKPVKPEAAEVFKKNASALDESLKSTKYVAGDELSVADISITVTISVASAMGIDTSELKNVEKWLKQVESDFDPSTWQTLVIDSANGLGTYFKSKAFSS